MKFTVIAFFERTYELELKTFHECVDDEEIFIINNLPKYFNKITSFLQKNKSNFVINNDKYYHITIIINNKHFFVKTNLINHIIINEFNISNN